MNDGKILQNEKISFTGYSDLIPDDFSHTRVTYRFE